MLFDDGQSLSPHGIIARPLAVCCIARDLELRFEVETKYLCRRSYDQPVRGSALDTMSLGFCFALAASAIGSSGCVHAQTGPLVGFTPGQGVMVGWEGGVGAGAASATLGAELRPFGEALAKFYLALEPGIALPVQESSASEPDSYASFGGTGGIAIDERGAVAPLLGAWLGAVWLQSGSCHASWLDTFAISVGFHLFLDRPEREWTLYATPKFGTVGECSRISFPSQ